MSNKKEEVAVQLETLSTMHGEYRTTFTRKYRERTPWHPKDTRQIFSFIPGTMTTIDVNVGDVVREGDVLLTFKAMKMNNTYRSPVSGTVARIHVAVGDVAPKGVLLLEFA